MRMVHWIGLMMWVCVVACSPVEQRPVYAPAQGSNPLGYTVNSLSGDEYLVVFNGDRRLGIDEVESFAFQRVSELAIESGKAGFDLLDKTCGEETVAWVVPEHRGNFVTPGDVPSPVGESWVPGYTHERVILSCKLRIRLLDKL
jgi:hypothetical protein